MGPPGGSSEAIWLPGLLNYIRQMIHFYLIIFCSLLISAPAQAADSPGQQTNLHLRALATNPPPALRLKHLVELLKVAEDPVSKESRPYWSHKTVQAELEKLATADPSTIEGKSARLWLAVLNQYSAQTNTTPASAKASHQPVVRQLKELRLASRDSWQAKAVDLIIGYAELAGGNPQGARTEFMNLLNQLPQILKEKDEEFTSFLKAVDIRLQDAEPEAKLGMAMAFSFEGKNEEAIKTLREVNTRFPRWSKRNGVDGKIESLQRGTLPWKLPAYE